ncbi:MAG: sodium:solute symporter, partial [Candidatus Hydrogenedentes bacterium]|nr:sodium:solute symporter [Candidatus Hydrogenedentota bacterium]
PAASDRRLVTAGRVFTFIGLLLAVAWSPLLGRFPSVFQGINAAICYIAPPITVVFVFGVFWRGASATGAIITLVLGSGLGFTVFLLDWFKETTGWNVPFMMAGFYLAVACGAVLVGVSLSVPDPRSPERDALTWSSPLAPFRGEKKGLETYQVVAGLLCVVMLGLYIVFH